MMSSLGCFMDVEQLGGAMPEPPPCTPQYLVTNPGMLDVASYIEVGPINDPTPVQLPIPVPPVRRQEALHAQHFQPNHVPAEYCYFCSCIDCRTFYAVRKPVRPVEPPKQRKPEYAYLGFVNAMREAAMRREEERLEKLQAERAAELAAKNEQEEKDKKEKLRQAMKRRRPQ